MSMSEEEDGVEIDLDLFRDLDDIPLIEETQELAASSALVNMFEDEAQEHGSIDLTQEDRDHQPGRVDEVTRWDRRRTARNWCGTWFTPLESTGIPYKDLFEETWIEEQGVVRLIVGSEICPSTGRHHFQLACSFKDPKRASWMRRKFPGIHWSRMRKEWIAQEIYCSKEKHYFSHNAEPRQGKRNDIIEFCERLEKGERVKALAKIYKTTYVRYSRGLVQYGEIQQAHRDRPPTVFWIYGPSGVGKSRSVHAAKTSEDSLWVANSTGKFWNGYDHHPQVLFDDWAEDRMDFATVLQIFDRYPFTVETKGAHCVFNSNTIYVTSAEEPSKYWPNESPESMRQLYRRITCLIECDYASELFPGRTIYKPSTYTRQGNKWSTYKLGAIVGETDEPCVKIDFAELLERL